MLPQPSLADLAAKAPAPRSCDRPSPILEHLGSRLLAALAPKVPDHSPKDPPSALGPWWREQLTTADGGRLSQTGFPVEGAVRGVVVLAHPWVPGGQSYFFRRNRLIALRRAGYHALTFDFPGFGQSRRSRAGFADRDLDAVLDFAGAEWPDLSLYFWGVSGGGYWGHLALSSRRDVESAFFEEVPAHLIDWSDRISPKNRPFHSFYRHALRGAYRFLDLRRHASHLRLRRVAYVSCCNDPGIFPEETRALADLAGGELLLIPDAGHLDAIKRAGSRVVDLALRTFGGD